MRNKRSLSAALIVLICNAATVSFAQEAAVVPSPQATSSKPYSASIEIQNINTITYGDPIFVSVRVTPISSLAVQSITLIPQGELAKLYGTKTVNEKKETVWKWPCVFGSVSKPAGIPFHVSCEIRPSFKNTQYFAIDTLLLPASRHKMLLQTKQVSGGRTVEHYDEVFVDVVPTKASVMVGALIGALVLSLFFATYRSEGVPPIQSLQELLARAAKIPFHAIEVVRQALLAATCALILILLADLSDGGQPPISLNVEDFWGGVIVGLFSVPLARWIARRLPGTGSDQTGERSGSIAESDDDDGSAGVPADAAAGAAASESVGTDASAVAGAVKK